MRNQAIGYQGFAHIVRTDPGRVMASACQIPHFTQIHRWPMNTTKKRYNDFSTSLRHEFGCRVQKITVDAGFSCPNRDGTLSKTGCLYCNGRGAGSGAANRGRSIEAQIREGKARMAARYKAKKFIAYFQAFTNTYAPVEVLKRRYEDALQDPDIVSLAIGTRPDCVDPMKLALIESYTSTHTVWIEYGLQSARDGTLRQINRGHTVEDFVHAVDLTQGRDIRICAHVILGLPGESLQDAVRTARLLAHLRVDAVKIHNLYIEADTPLASLFKRGRYLPLSQETYVDWVIHFLEHLHPETILQRLTGDPDPRTLIAPSWATRKGQTLSMITQGLEDRQTFQGRRYSAESPLCRPLTHTGINSHSSPARP